MRKVKVWSYDVEDYIEKEVIGKVKYLGESFQDITSDKIYDCLGVEDEFLRIVDDEEMDYLYSKTNPAPLDGSSEGGRWKVVEDDENETLKKTIYG